jgi:hypothetical protein
MSGNKGSARMTSLSTHGTSKTDEMFSLLVNKYYADLLSASKDKDNQFKPSEDFPHYSPYGIRLTLGSLLEILLTGEEVLAEYLLGEVNGLFPGIKGIEAFDDVCQSLRQIFQTYSQKFCKECTAPLVKAIRHIADQGNNAKTEKEKYDRYPYSV